MSNDDKENTFVRPEVVDDESTDRSEENQQDTEQSQGVILASKYMPDRIYLLPTGTKPVFPGIMFPLVLSPDSLEAQVLKDVVDNVQQRIVGFVLTKEEGVDASQIDDELLYRIGTAARVLRAQQNEDGNLQILLQGARRFQILKAVKREKKLVAQVAYLEDIPSSTEEVRAMSMSITATMRELIQNNPLYSEEIKMFLQRADWDDPGQLADFAANMTSASREELQDVLECLNVHDRLEKVLFLLRKELDLTKLKEKITKQIEERISKQQREYFLREQLKAIKEELGLEKDEKTEEIEKYQARVDELDLPSEARSRIEEELEKLKLLSPQSPEFSVSRNYLDWLTGMPWGVYSKERLSVKRARRILNRDHYGLEDVKKRILEFIGVAKLRGGVEGSILCLIGPPGVGKTSLGKGIAEALGRRFFRFSLGGIRDEAEIKGHRRTYIGALPGKVMQAIKNVGTANPVVMLDEIDKVGQSFQGDPASALLEVLDPEQNASFRDHYLDVPFDLSKVLFIGTANVPDTIPGPLLDRMEVIRLSGYIQEEKVAIAKRHLIPRLLERHALTRETIRFTDGALRGIIEGYTREAGVRAMEKTISACMRKVAAERAEGDRAEQAVVRKNAVEDFLGTRQYHPEQLMKRPRPGVVTGLAWTPYGGSTLYVEAIGVPAKEADIKLTGQLGNVMVESSHIAYSLVTSQTAHYKIDEQFFEDKTIHLHVPAGATPKDGPSAGITMATALASLALDKEPPANLAMTGELTLSGRVLPVGGIKEKVIAANRSKITDVILPAENKKDFNDIPERVRKGVTPHFVEDFNQVYRLVFETLTGRRLKRR